LGGEDADQGHVFPKSLAGLFAAFAQQGLHGLRFEEAGFPDFVGGQVVVQLVCFVVAEKA